MVTQITAMKEFGLVNKQEENPMEMPITKLENGKFYWQGKRDMSNYDTAFKAPFLVYSA